MNRPPKSLIDQFEAIFREDGLGHVEERMAVLKEFLSVEQHVTSHELTDRLHEGGVALDEGRVRHALELFCRYGLASQRAFQDRDVVYEHCHLGEHHDHLICVRCGEIEEFTDSEIEKHQQSVAQRHGFRSLRHRMEIYGLCRKCALPPRRAFPLTMASVGERAIVTNIVGGHGMLRRLGDMGLRPGVEILVISPGCPGPFLVAVKDSRIALGRGMAQHVMIAPKEPAE